MRQLIKQRELIADAWRYADEDAATAVEAAGVIVPLARFQQERDQWLASSQKIGVRLAPSDSIEAVANDLPRLDLVALEFSGIGEGRGYTHAQLLRRRYRFQGEIRAVGKIQRDQVFYLARCGVDAFEFPPDADLQAALAAFNDFSVVYQPAVDRNLTLRQRVS